MMNGIVSDDEAELNSLSRKPTCFVVWGKPCAGKTTIATHLSKDWNCILINSITLVQEAITEDTKEGNALLTRLFDGATIEEDTIFNLLKEKIASPQVQHYGYILDGFPCINANLSPKEQLDMIWSWKMKPDIIVNIKLYDKDAETRRSGQRVDFLTLKMYSEEMYIFQPHIGETSEGEEEYEHEEESEESEKPADEYTLKPIMTPEIFDRLVKKPEDMGDLPISDIMHYRAFVLPLVEDQIEKHRRQHVIELDGNLDLPELYRQLSERLNLLSLHRSVFPHLLLEDEEDLAEVDENDVFRSLAGTKVISPGYLWHLSKFKNICPVALFEGSMLMGQPQYTVTYLDKFYMLSSVDAVSKFQQNPRPYILPSNFRIPCKLCIIGLPLSGKTTICAALAEHYSADVITVEDHVDQFLTAKKEAFIEEERLNTMKVAIEEVRKRLEVEGFEEGDEKNVLPEVDDSHPEVEEAVNAAVANAEAKEFPLTANMYVEMLNDLIAKVEEHVTVKSSGSKSHGGYILDGCPAAPDQWTVFLEEGAVVDDVIVLLDDDGHRHTALEKRWFKKYYECSEGDIPEVISESEELGVFLHLVEDAQRKCEQIIALISRSLIVQPKIIDVAGKSIDDLRQEIVAKLEDNFKHKAGEMSNLDEDEENAEIRADEYLEEFDENIDVLTEKFMPLGETSSYDTVILAQKKVLMRGEPDYGAKYRDKVYYFTNEENRSKFIYDPLAFLPRTIPLAPPAVRIVMLGPRGAGKTFIGKALAKKLGVFYVNFRERLQEIIRQKTVTPVNPEEFEEQVPLADSEEAEEESIGGEEENPKETYDLTDEEENIFHYFSADDKLAPDTLEKYLAPFWHEEPFKSLGFVMEDFPQMQDDAQYLGMNNLLPDVAVSLDVDEDIVILRLLPNRQKQWKEKREKLLQKKQKKKDEIMSDWKKKVEARRTELETERRLERGEESNEDEFSLYSEDEETDIEDVLEDELPEPYIDEEDLESFDEATERMKDELSLLWQEGINELELIKDALAEFHCPVIELDGSRKSHVIHCRLDNALKPIIQHRKSLFERVYPIEVPAADDLLSAGYVSLSKFGKWCPVKLLEGEHVVPKPPFFPVTYRQYVYFLSSSQARKDFMQDPLYYIDQTPPSEMAPLKLAILGPPKSGKTTIAKRLVQEFGILRISAGSAMRYVLKNQPNTELAKKLNHQLMCGLTASVELIVQAVEVNLTNSICQSRGYVLDGFPVMQYQIDLMTDRSIIPICVIELQLEPQVTFIRGQKDRSERTLPLHDSLKILAFRTAEWHKEFQAVQHWYEMEHKNVTKVDGSRSRWWVWNAILSAAKISVARTQRYLNGKLTGEAVPLLGLCIRPYEFEEKLGEFGKYCPVCLAEDELTDCSDDCFLQYAAEFKNKHYVMCSIVHLDAFLIRAQWYVLPAAPNALPPEDCLPKPCFEELSNEEVALQGFCPVTFVDGLCAHEALIKGCSKYGVKYKNKFFVMTTVENQEKFLRKPEKYANATIIVKLPSMNPSLVLTALPMLGYLEQTVAMALIRAMTSAALFKPKFPCLSIEASAQVFLAYHLKVHNPYSSDFVRQKYRELFQKYKDQCNLIGYLSNNMTPFYVEPEYRPHDFNKKMNDFMNIVTSKGCDVNWNLCDIFSTD